MIINYIALITALSVSAVSGYYSIIGLTTIFAASFWPVVIMGGVLEAGKLVTASWLYRNWSTTSTLLKTYLMSAVVILMLITSMGIYGFLSKAHIDQLVNLTTGSADKIAILDNRIKVEEQAIQDIDTQLSQINNAITKMVEKGQAQSSLNAADRQRKLRDDLVKQKNGRIETISKLREEKIPLESSLKKMEAEVGPIKYIAQLLFSDESSDTLERAVRAVTLLLVIVFDPLAVALLIAANNGLINSKKKKVRKSLTKKPRRDNVLRVDNRNITKFIDKEQA